MKNKIILTALAITSAGAVALGTSTVSAQQTTATETYPPIVQKLAQRFGLNEHEVQAVFDEAQAEHHQQMQKRIEDRLQQAVSDGTLTQEQFEAIKLKHQELHQQRTSALDDWRRKGHGERQRLMQTHREELKNWYEANGLTFDQLFLSRHTQKTRQ